MLLFIAVLIVVLWLMGGFAFHVGGELIHLLLVIGIVLVLAHVFLPRLRGRNDL